MSLINLKNILAGTLAGGYAVGGFNFNSFEDLKGMVHAATEKRSPIIVMSSPNTARYIGLGTVCGMLRGLAADAGIPICLHLDHTTDVDFIFACVRAGFTSVMIDASELPFEKNIEITRRVVSYAHAYDCSVEAELGTISGREEDADTETACLTDPGDVPRFVSETGIDALAVAVGTVHGFYKSQPNIDFDRIRRIRQITGVPLVLHGGTGVSSADFQRAIACGIGKINVGTELKHAYSATLRTAVSLLGDEEDPRKYMGMVIRDCAGIVRDKIDMFGSAGKADNDREANSA